MVKSEAVKEIFEGMSDQEISNLAERMRDVKKHGWGCVLIYIEKGLPAYSLHAKGNPIRSHKVSPEAYMMMSGLMMAGIPGRERHRTRG